MVSYLSTGLSRSFTSDSLFSLTEFNFPLSECCVFSDMYCWYCECSLSMLFLPFYIVFPFSFPDKDIQSQIPNDLQQPYGAEDVYCKIESPPCYTIATGLPTYSEALLLYSQQYEHQLGYLWLPSLWNHHSQQGELQQRQPENIKATASEPVSREDDNFAGCSGLSVVGGNLGLPTKDSDNGHRMPGTTGSVREVTIPSQSLESGNILTEVVVAS